MRRMGWNREVCVAERQFKNIPQVELGVVAQSSAGIGGRMLAFGEPKFSAVEPTRLLACPIRHAHKDHSLVVVLGRNDEAWAWFGFGMNVVFTKARKNPYASNLIKQTTIRLDEDSIGYFKGISEQVGISYQGLINVYLRDCAAHHRKLDLCWK